MPDHADSAPTGDDQQVREPAASRPRRVVLFTGLAVAILVADLVTKQIALAQFSAENPTEVLGGLLILTLTFNSGAAFSIGQGFPWVFTLVATAVVGYILWVARRIRSQAWAVSLGLILGGATGNLVDRYFREPGPLLGHVVDWIRLPTFPVVNYDFPVFNIADSAIVCGGILAVWLAFRGVNLDGERETAAGTAAEAGRE